MIRIVVENEQHEFEHISEHRVGCEVLAVVAWSGDVELVACDPGANGQLCRDSINRMYATIYGGTPEPEITFYRVIG